MSMNRIQFQKGLSMYEFMQQYGSEEQCEAAVVAARWPRGWVCAHCHKRLQTMLLREEPRRLEGRVEIDDAYLGGERAGHFNGGFNAYNKSAFVAWANASLAPSAHVVSDGLQCFTQVTQLGSRHERYITGGGRKAAQTPQLRWVNTMLGNLKMALAGTYHSFDHAKYAARYLAEFSYRFNRRFDLAAMLPRLLCAAVTTAPQPRAIIRCSEAGI